MVAVRSAAEMRFDQTASVIIPTTASAARSLVRTADPTDRGLIVAPLAEVMIKTDRTISHSLASSLDE